jgi:hypothetical protein
MGLVTRLAVVLALSACGHSGANAPAGPASTESLVTPSQRPEAEGVTDAEAEAGPLEQPPAVVEAPCSDAELCAITLSGPHESIEAYCREVRALPWEGGEGLSETRCLAAETGRLAAPATPFTDAAVVAVMNRYADDFSILAVRTDRGWFFSVPPSATLDLDAASGEPLVYVQPQSGGERTITDFLTPTVDDVVPGDGPELRWEVWRETYATSSGEVYGVFQSFTLCGIGPAGAPSCLSLPVAQKRGRRRPGNTLPERYGRARDVYRITYAFEDGEAIPRVRGRLPSDEGEAPRGRVVFR